MLDLVFGNSIPHTKCNGGLCFILKCWLDRTYSFGAIFIFWHFGLKLPIHDHLGGFGGIISTNGVIYRCNPQPKGTLRRNHVCKLLNMKFSGITILQGVEFPSFLFIHVWACALIKGLKLSALFFRHFIQR